ncbi:MAG: YebC/PmpR family DNA-binding transcriptional regulator [Gammaproteobacteria bacterium]|nr:MAG: YebC/PmpR family DNA-binding transcriptional regulator [Gammaproteobacteria bacterium]
MGRAYQNRKESMAKTSDMKAKIYSRHSREIYMAAKAGGTDVSGNLTLRGLIERAKKDQVPAHVIDKALKKAESGAGEDFAPARYEGYGPGGCMVIVECLTDNPNRTFGDVRQAWTKTQCKIGTEGSVSHLFDHVAIFVFAYADEEAVLDALMEADVDVIDIENENGQLTVFAPHTEYFKTKQALLACCGDDTDFTVDEIQFIPQAYTEISGDDVELFEKFLAILDDVDDVQNIYHNVKQDAA